MKCFNSLVSLSVFVILGLAAPAMGAADWEEYSMDNHGNVLLYKKGDVERDEGNYIVQVWKKRVYSEKGREIYIQDRKREGRSTEGYDKLSNTQNSYKIDCKKQLMELLSIVRYDTNGKVLYSYSIDESGWNSIIPDTTMDALRKKVCE